ncbi:MAG: hypothetical protein NTW87_28435 [Planctomycetota bacterium]|nr:hypothetical protein [Planctomycetota bacterium]
MIVSKSETLRQLRSEIRGIERSSISDKPRSFISSGFKALDAILPGGGLPLGSLVELLGDEASGALTFALQLARKAIETKAAWAVVDTAGSFYPPAAAQRGLDIGKLIVIRIQPHNAAWAFGQLLRCPDVGASFLCRAGVPAYPASPGKFALRTASLDNMTYRRLQLAAERGGGLGFVLRPKEAIRRPCWAAVRLLVEGSGRRDWSVPSTRRALRVVLLHVRESNATGSVTLDIDE